MSNQEILKGLETEPGEGSPSSARERKECLRRRDWHSVFTDSEVEADVHENIYYFYSKIEDVKILHSRLYIQELTLPFRFEEIFIGCLLGARHCAYYQAIL